MLANISAIIITTALNLNKKAILIVDLKQYLAIQNLKTFKSNFYEPVILLEFQFKLFNNNSQSILFLFIRFGLPPPLPRFENEKQKQEQ